MSQEPLINLEVRFLIARHGRDRLLEAIADVGHVDVAEVASALEAFESRNARARDKGPRRRKPVDADALIERLGLDPERDALVRQLVRAFEGGEFMPQLSEVRRFLASAGIDANVRSRRDALPQVIQALGNSSIGHLRDLAARSEEPRRGDLGLIADQILGERS
jgi:hypothetical protein